MKPEEDTAWLNHCAAVLDGKRWWKELSYETKTTYFEEK